MNYVSIIPLVFAVEMGRKILYITYMGLEIYAETGYLAFSVIFFVYGCYLLYRYFRQPVQWKIYTLLYLYSYSLLLIFCYLWFRDFHFIKFAPGLILFLPLSVLTASAYLATRVVVYPDYHYNIKVVFHYLPFVTGLLAVIVLWFNDYKVSIEFFTETGLYERGFVVWALVALIDILVYIGYQIAEVVVRLVSKKEAMKNRFYRNTLLVLLIVRSLNFTLPLVIFLEIVSGLSPLIIKISGLVLALNSLLLTTFMGLYSMLFKIPRSSESDRRERGAKGEAENFFQNLQWIEISLVLDQIMKDEKIFTDEKLDLYRVSKMLDLSPRALSDYLNSCVGISFPEYLANLRVDEAMRLFRETSMSVAEVTYATGFGSSSRFYEHFRKRTGLTPVQYRQKFQ